MSNKKSSGISFGSLLLLAFIVLKLCNVITWSWWWVLSPFWITCIVVFLLLTIYGLISLWKDKEGEQVFTSKNKWDERIDEMKSRQKHG